jgi:hypothetical protein
MSHRSCGTVKNAKSIILIQKRLVANAKKTIKIKKKRRRICRSLKNSIGNVVSANLPINP